MVIDSKKDVGMEYLQEIGFKDPGDGDIYKRWEELFGKKMAKELYSKWEIIGSGTTEFYDFKNSTPELSKSFSEIYDGIILTKACNFIFENKDYFGSTILEIGCEAGYMTGFLAKTFPDSKILSIDRNASALNIAEKRIADLNISNVEFRNCDLSGVNETFDTVFCMRTIQENYSRDDTPHEGEPLLYLFGCYKKLTREYTRLLADHLKDSGTLCVFERIGHNPLMCGWLLELENNNCGINLNTYQEITCKEAAVNNTFQAFIAQKGHKNTMKMILDLWYAPVSNYNSNIAFLKGWRALDYLNRNAGRLVRGVRIYETDSKYQVGRFALFTDCDNEPYLYLLVSTGKGDDVCLYSYEKNQKNEKDALDKIQELVDENVKIGFRYEEIGPEDKIVEGRIRLGFVKKS